MTAYTYNARGQRSRAAVLFRGTTLYHYDLNGRLISETNESGTLIKDYVWVDTSPLTQLDAVPGGPEAIHYLHTDHLDTPRLATNATGTIDWRWDSTAFGDGYSDEDPDRDGRYTTINLRLPGQYYDNKTRLYYNWNRYYDPATGRYITADPIGLAGGVESVPIRRIKPPEIY